MDLNRLEPVAVRADHSRARPPVTPSGAYVSEDEVEEGDYETRQGGADVTLADLQQLRWGPIVAGLLTAIGLFVLMTLLAVAVGLQAAPGTEAVEDMGIVALLVTSIIALVSFFVGGFVSTWTAGVSDPGRSLVNGFLVWALWVVAVAILAAFGVGAIAGAMGELFGQLSAPDPDLEPDALVDALRDASWQSFLAMALTALAAALGGVVGSREDLRGAWMRRVGARVRT